MKAFGFLSFRHYADVPGSATRTAGDMLRQTIAIAEGASEGEIRLRMRLQGT